MGVSGEKPLLAEQAENRPTLSLITGSLDPAWQHLEPDDDGYKAFWGAWKIQHEWDRWAFELFWWTHIDLWPRHEHRGARTGLKAQVAALWRRAGYSRAQIERAFGYTHGAPKSLWVAADDYADWLAQQPIRVSDLGSVEALEEMYAAGADPTLRASAQGYVLPSEPIVEAGASDAAEQARRWVRKRFRTPRVVTLGEWERSRFGWPEPFSTQVLYVDSERQLVRSADSKLRAERPYRAPTRRAA